jgi:hypothetical protein
MVGLLTTLQAENVLLIPCNKTIYITFVNIRIKRNYNVNIQLNQQLKVEGQIGMRHIDTMLLV